MDNKINEPEKDKDKDKNKTLADIISGLKSASKEKKEENDLKKENAENANEINDNELIKEKKPEKIILDLQQKIILLEKKNNDLKTKNDILTKNNVEKSALMMKMSLAGLRRKFASPGSLQSKKSEEISEIIKEKDELQQMNEKMLDLLTDKEIENEDLIEKLENYKLETKLENEKYIEKIQILEEKIQSLENSKGNGENNTDIDSLIHEYNNYKERLKKQLNEYIKNEGDLRHQLEIKDRAIQRLNEDIQGLEVENLQLVNQFKRNEQIKDDEIVEIEQLKSENDHMKREMGFLADKLKIAEERAKNENKSHEEEINDFQRKIEDEQNYLKSYQESKIKEINILKNEITRNNREINFYNQRIDLIEKLFEDEKLKNSDIQNKLDKKTKELQNMNEYTKKLLSNKDNIISEYEEKMEKISKDKNDLSSQTKELLEKIKLKTENTAKSLADIITEDENKNIKEDLDHFMQENKLLNEEIKGLKEQLLIQAKELVDLNILDKEIVRLKGENEILINDNKAINKKLEEQKKKEEEELLTRKKTELIKAIRSLKKKSGVINEIDRDNYEKQIEALKKLKEDEKNDYEEQIKKLKLELVLIKLRNIKQLHKNESLLKEYRSAIKLLSNQFIKKYSFYIIGGIILIFAIRTFVNK